LIETIFTTSYHITMDVVGFVETWTSSMANARCVWIPNI
jgi:hypothetical protein